MHTIAVLTYWLLFSLMFPTTHTLTWRGQEYLANRADSLAVVVRAELHELDSLRGFLDEQDHSLDSLFMRWPDDNYYLGKKRELARFRERADSIEVELRAELDGLD